MDGAPAPLLEVGDRVASRSDWPGVPSGTCGTICGRRPPRPVYSMPSFAIHWAVTWATAHALTSPITTSIASREPG
jgi:hypothetical protein